MACTLRQSPIRYRAMAERADDSARMQKGFGSFAGGWVCCASAPLRMSLVTGFSQGLRFRSRQPMADRESTAVPQRALEYLERSYPSAPEKPLGMADFRGGNPDFRVWIHGAGSIRRTRASWRTIGRAQAAIELGSGRYPACGRKAHRGAETGLHGRRCWVSSW
jgi:hypothetical protein